jgi:hypothetical protein
MESQGVVSELSGNTYSDSPPLILLMILIILTHVWQPNDAKGLNGKFRVESTKAKRKLLLA